MNKMKEIRNNWSKDEISEIYNLPLFELMNKAQKAVFLCFY